MDRNEAIELLVEHYEDPQHRHKLEDPDVTMPGGNPGCGDIIVVYLKGGEDGKVLLDYSWEGEGCTISQAAASILAEMVHEENWTLEDILNADYNDMMDNLGREVVQTRTRCATLALGTLKAAVRKFQRDRMLTEEGLEHLIETGDVEAGLEQYGLVIGEDAVKSQSGTNG